MLQPARARWVGRAVIGLLLVLAFILLLRFDVTLMRWRFVLVPGEFSGGAQQILFGLRDFAQIVPIVVVGIVVVLMDRRWRAFVLALLLSQGLVLLVCHPGKWCVPRYRPYPAMATVTGPDAQTKEHHGEAAVLARMRPGQMWALDADRWPPVRGRDSFPSGHSAGAFAFAAVLAAFYPRLRWVFWVLAAGCAVSRYLDAVHWPSDCLAGASIGYAAGRLVLHTLRGRLRPSADAGDVFAPAASA